MKAKTPAKKPAKPVAKTRKLPSPDVRYTDAIAEEICNRLKDGESLNSICKDKHMPTESAVRGWAMDDYRGFSANYLRAREIGYSRLAEEIIQITNTPIIGEKRTTKPLTMRNSDGDIVPTGEFLEEVVTGDMIEHRRLQVDTRKWLLSKVLPKVYGDKQTLEHTGTLNVAEVLSAARKRSGKPV